MNEIKQRALAFLDETVTYYAEDINRRCVLPTIGVLNAEGKMLARCQYDPAKVNKLGISEGCAIGRKMTLEQKAVATARVSDLPREILPESLREFDMRFLTSVQGLHDDDSVWGVNGLTENGHKRVAKIKSLLDTLYG